MTLKTVMESLTNQTKPVDYSQLQNLFNQARSLLFPDFPIYDEYHRIPLQNLIMSKFLNREICETPYAYWHVLFNQKLMTIMPMYNILYKSISQTDNMFNDVNYTRTIKRDDTITKNSESTDTSSNKIKFDDTTTYESNGKETGNNTLESNQTGVYNPGSQSITTNLDTPQSEIESFMDNKYLTSAQKNINSGEDNSTSTTHSEDSNIVNRETNDTTISDSTRNENGTLIKTGKDIDITDGSTVETMIGKTGGKSYGEMIAQLKDNIFSVDNMILNDLEELFFMVY